MLTFFTFLAAGFDFACLVAGFFSFADVVQKSIFKAKEEVISKVTDQAKAANAVIEQELLNEERQDSDTEE